MKLIGKKGQWFLISAVIISSSFLVISMLFKSYQYVDTSIPAGMDEDHLFDSIEIGLKNTVAGSDCSDMDKNLKEFKAFSEQKMAELGKYLEINYTIVDCSTENVRFNVSLSTNVMRVGKAFTTG